MLVLSNRSLKSRYEFRIGNTLDVWHLIICQKLYSSSSNAKTSQQRVSDSEFEYKFETSGIKHKKKVSGTVLSLFTSFDIVLFFFILMNRTLEFLSALITF